MLLKEIMEKKTIKKDTLKYAKNLAKFLPEIQKPKMKELWNNNQDNKLNY